MKQRKPDTTVIVSFVLLLAILLFFAVLTDGRMFSSFSIRSIIDQTIIFIITGLGCIFVVSLGSADLSIGTTLGISAVVGVAVASATGMDWLMLPVSIAIGLAQGLLNGFLVAKMKVPSFMVTLSFLIGMRGFILFIQSKIGNNFYLSGWLLSLQNDTFRYGLVLMMIIIIYIILSHTKFGVYCMAIGENESVAISIGIPVAKVKIQAFVLSGLMASIAGFFLMVKVGGTNNTMGTGLEIDVLMCIFLGGVLVTGGYGAKISKLLIGAFILSIIKNGMVSIGQSSVAAVQSTEGILLILILIATLQITKREARIWAFFSRRKGIKQAAKDD